MLPLWVAALPIIFQKCVGAMLIPDSAPGIYRDFLGGMKE